MKIIDIAYYINVALAVCAELAGLYALFVLGDERVVIVAGLLLTVGLLGLTAAFIVKELKI
jgi:hypothetical protein